MKQPALNRTRKFSSGIASAQAKVVSATASTPSNSSSSSSSGSGSSDSNANTSSSSSSNIYYRNYTAASETEVAPVHRGDPGYASHLDRYGIECE